MSGRMDLTKVDVEHFLGALGVRNVQRSSYEWWKFSCPFSGHSHGDETPSAQMNDTHTGFNCFGCKRTGNAITFLSEYEGVSFMEARRWLREEYGGEFREPQGGAAAEWADRFREAEAEDERQTYLDESVRERFDVDWPDAFCEWSQTHDPALGYMFARGFEPETLMDWQIGYDDITARFTIPVRDVDGRLVGFKGRAWDPEAKPKYLALGDTGKRKPRYGFPTFEKSLVVFGLDRARATGRLIVCEGELNAIAMHQIGHEDAVATAGSDVSEAQALLIREYCDEVVVFYDSDVPGMQATWGFRDEKKRYRPGVVDALEPFMHVRVVQGHDDDAAALVQAGRGGEIEGLIDRAPGSVAARARVRSVV